MWSNEATAGADLAGVFVETLFFLNQQFFVFVNLPKNTALDSLPFMLKHRPSWKPAKTTVVLKEQCHENKLIFKTSGGSFGFNNQPENEEKKQL